MIPDSHIARHKYARLPLHRLILHRLLHLPETERRMGPASTFWAYTLEKRISSIRSQIKSRMHPYSNLVGRILTQERLRVFEYATNISLAPPELPCARPRPRRTVAVDTATVTLRHPHLPQYKMTCAERQAVDKLYRTEVLVGDGQQQVFIFLSTSSDRAKADTTVSDAVLVRGEMGPGNDDEWG